MLKKTPEETKLSDSERSSSWALIADKGYIGLEEEIRIILPHKGSNLTTLVRAHAISNTAS